MEYIVRDRNGNETVLKESKTVKFFYGTVLGRFFVKLFSYPFFSKFIGWFLSKKFSKILIRGFVKKNNIDLDLFVKDNFVSFNDFFIREMKKEHIKVDMQESSFISPSDANLICYDINENSEFKIKNSYYKVSDLLDNNSIYKEYIGGYMLVFRLQASNYHRYCYIDKGVSEKNIFIPGVLNTVRPIVLEKFNIYKRNAREYNILHTDNFGDIVEIEVGAVLVGKINNYYENYSFVRGEEKGRFEFGGSTIVLLVKKDIIDIDKDILENSKLGIETEVKFGEKIGERKSLKK